MGLRSRVVAVLAGSLLALSMAGLAPASTQVAAASSSASSSSTSLAKIGSRLRDVVCQDVVFVGARGSGENSYDDDGLGKNVEVARNEFVTKVDGRRVGWHAVDYPASSVGMLAKDPEKYFKGLKKGVIALQDFLAERSAMCPREKYLLSGYSQGAMVVHRSVWAMADPDDQWLGAILIADGDRVPNDRSYAWGSAPRKSYGITWAMREKGNSRVYAKAKQLPAFVDDGTFISVCDRDDIVCDAGRLRNSCRSADLPSCGIKLDRGARIHASDDYRNSGSDTRLAARVLGAKINQLTPVPEFKFLTKSLPEAEAGAPYEFEIAALLQGGEPPFKIQRVSLPTAEESARDLHWANVSESGAITGVPDPSALKGLVGVVVRDANGQYIRATLELGACSVTGTKGADTLYGTPGDDVICGLGGNDVIHGYDGNDVIIGGSGADEIYGDSGRDVIVGGSGDDHIEGGSGDDTVWGEKGGDDILGQSGDDDLRGGSGGDRLAPGKGSDRVDGGSGSDWVVFWDVRASVTVRLDKRFATGHGTDRLLSIENVEGSNRNDKIYGTGSKNTLIGNDGSDRLYGLGGNDYLQVQGGHDYMSGGSGKDTCESLGVPVKRSSCERIIGGR